MRVSVFGVCVIELGEALFREDRVMWATEGRRVSAAVYLGLLRVTGKLLPRVGYIWVSA